MKNLFVFCCFLFLAGGASAQTCYKLEFDRGMGGLIFEPRWEQVSCFDGGDGGGGPATGDPPPQHNPNLPPTTCNTNVTLVSQTTHTISSGCTIIEEKWAHSCTSGNQGTCRTGFSYKAIAVGCEEIELPPDPRSKFDYS
jgi:hypothetical protein